MEQAMAGTNKKDFSTFFLAFMGQQMTLTTELMGSVSSDTEHGAITESYPIFYEGILLDEDHDYFYLGKSPNEIDQFVLKSKVIHGKISDQSEVIEELLNQIPTPENESEIN